MSRLWSHMRVAGQWSLSGGEVAERVENDVVVVLLPLVLLCSVGAEFASAEVEGAGGVASVAGVEGDAGEECWGECGGA